jgi:hypothetical protein
MPFLEVFMCACGSVCGVCECVCVGVHVGALVCKVNTTNQ